METKKQMPEGLKKVKESFTINDLKSNLIIALVEAKILCESKSYVVEGSIDKMMSNINLENSTLTSRKKLAKKVYYFMKKKSLKTMSSLFSFIKNRFAEEEFKVKVKPSILEQEIVSLRENYKKLYKETEEIRIAWKEKKKILNEKNII